VDIIEQSERRLRLRVRGRISMAVCTLDRASDTAEVTHAALGIGYRRKRLALSSIANVAVRRRARRKVYRPVLEVRFGDAIPLGDYGKEEALDVVRAIRDFLRIAQ
jgi:hypothetical protein